MRRAAADLGLPDLGDHQDWGIEFADAARLPEFVAYYRAQQGGFDEWAEEYDLGELLFQSANDAFLSDLQPQSVIEEAATLVAARQEYEATRLLLNYWTRLDSHEWIDGDIAFPIAAMLRRALSR